MERYQFTDAQRSLMERMQVPFAVYQFINKRVETLLISDGFCELFGYEDHEEAFRDMEYDMYKNTHPDDAPRMADAAYRFATEGGTFEVIYRYKRKGHAEYDIIHCTGKHSYAEDGTRLAYVWYTEEGSYKEQPGMRGLQLDRAMTSALHEESIIRATNYDELTGLPSMTRFFDLAEAGRVSMLENGEEPVLLFIDMSGLKFFNQKNGFNEGNKLLRAFAKLLALTFKNENCSRFGQDHFAVYTKADGLEETLDKLFAENEKINDGIFLPVRVGIYKNSVENVDVSTACDRAKEASDELRNTYVSGCNYFSLRLETEMNLKGYILGNLDRAIEEKWIKVYYQPIIRAVSGKVCDDEALSRWIDPEKGLLSPGDFIPLLEEAGLIYKLDLYVLEQVLEKIRSLEKKGFYIVPHSINLSRSDFHSCDIVEEIRKRVDEAGVSREKIRVEITESTIGRDFDFMKEQIGRFRELGFQVWIDDFGSGYSSLNVLQRLEFDLIKFDMSFMQMLERGKKGEIILNELMKMATALGVDTICEGVETEEQIHFLQEIGCSKLQGFYYQRPCSMEEILEHYKDGIQLGYENPEEADYYNALGSVNMHDLSIIESDTAFRNLFNVFPMAVLEVRNGNIRYARTNRAYRNFMKNMFGYDMPPDMGPFAPGPQVGGEAFMDIIRKCCREKRRFFMNESMPDGSTVHSLYRKIGTNPLDGTEAVAIAVLSITDVEQETTYASLVRALSADYYNIFFVDIENEEFLEYSSPSGGEELCVEQRGDHFFEAVQRDALKRIYKQDREEFLTAFTKENVLKSLDTAGNFTCTYRLTDGGTPFYVNMTIVRNHPNGHHIIIGVRNVDAQMKQQEMMEKIRRDQVVYERISALSGGYLALYSIDPDTGHYTMYSRTEAYEQLGLSAEGEDFFTQGLLDGRMLVFEDDLPMYERFFTKENILSEIREKGLFILDYRLKINGKLIPVYLRAAIIREAGGDRLIAGVNKANEKLLQQMASKEMHDRQLEEGKTSTVDYQYFADCVTMPCCVIAVEKKEDGTCGDIRIVRANHAYKKAMGPLYYDDMPYYELVPQDNKFEDFCFKSAVMKQRMHAYVEVKALNSWIDQTLIPLASDNENIGYCQFIFEMTREADAERRATVSADIAEEIIKSSIRLVGADDIEISAGNVLDDLMKLSEAKGARIMLVDHENKKAVIFSERIVESAWPARKEGEEVITYDLIRTWERALGLSNSVIIKDEKDMNELEKVTPEWVATMRESGVTNLVMIPLKDRKNVIGYLYAVNFDIRKEVAVKEFIELMAFYLGTEISNHLLMDRLEKLSELDVLSGAGNRRAMSAYMKQYTEAPEKEPFGVVNIDLNGLKAVNDHYGHEAGDDLIVRSADILRKAFPGDRLFRTGGDEFLIITKDRTAESFQRKVDGLHTLLKDAADISMAVGAYWTSGLTDMDTAVRCADDRMYEDKKRYYERHPRL